MRSSIEYFINFEPKFDYHIFNRSNNREILFIDDYDRYHFLILIERYLKHYFDIHAFCLLGNHFHILASTRSIKSIVKHLKKDATVKLVKTQLNYLEFNKIQKKNNFHDLLCLQLRRLFIAYSKHFNKKYERNGNLFHRPFKRVAVLDPYYFKTLIIYIHKNPLKHNLKVPYEDYDWSSYQYYLYDRESFLEKSKALVLLGGLHRFILEHKNQLDFNQINKLTFEDNRSKK